MKKLSIAIAALLAAVTLTGCTGGGISYARPETERFEYSMYTALPSYETEPTAEQAAWLTSYRTAEENGVLRLYVQETSGNIALLDKRNGSLYFSVPPTVGSDTTATEDTKELMQSALQLTYFDGQVEKSVNSFKLSDPEKLTVETIDGGIRVTYVLGDSKRGLADIPQKLSDARFQELFVNHPELKESDKKRAKVYYEQDANGVWVLTDTKNTTLNLLSQILDRIGYSDEDLARDNEENGMPVAISDRLAFTVPVEYTLEGESLRTTVPMADVTYTSSKPLLSLCVNQYFGATAEKDGAILLPEGSGGLMYFSQDKTDTGTYSASLYGSDDTDTREDSNQADNDNRLPLYGLYGKTHGFLCLIEEGDALASIGAEKANSRTDLNAAWTTFDVRNVIRAVLGDGSLQSDVRVVQDEMYTGTLSYKYSFLAGEDLSYSDLAAYYRGYLTAKYDLTQTVAEVMPLQLNLIGGVRVEKSLIGFQYTGTRVLTDYEDALTLVDTLNGQGIEEISLVYSGVLSGGIGEESVTKRKLDKALGSTKTLQALADADGVTLHLAADVLTVPKDASGYNRYTQTAKTIDDSLSKKYTYNTVDLSPEKYDYILSPLYYNNICEKLTAFTDKEAFEGTALSDLGSRLYSHNGDSMVMFRQDIKTISTDVLASYADGRSLVLSNPYEAALPYASLLTNLPDPKVTKVIDVSVPFYQMAIHSLIGYSGTPLNEATDFERAVLTCAETGSLPYFRLFAAPSDSLTDTDFSELYSHSFDVWGERVGSVCTALVALYEQTGDLPITDHDLLQANVTRTVYGDRVAVYVNYTDEAVTVDGITVDAMSFETEVLA